MQGQQRWEPFPKSVWSFLAAAVGEEEEAGRRARQEAPAAVCHAHHRRPSGVNCEKAGLVSGWLPV